MRSSTNLLAHFGPRVLCAALVGCSVLAQAYTPAPSQVTPPSNALNGVRSTIGAPLPTSRTVQLSGSAPGTGASSGNSISAGAPTLDGSTLDTAGGTLTANATQSGPGSEAAESLDGCECV
jgi:hypothetical protein